MDETDVPSPQSSAERNADGLEVDTQNSATDPTLELEASNHLELQPDASLSGTDNSETEQSFYEYYSQSEQIINFTQHPIKRIEQDYIDLTRECLPGIKATRSPDNAFVWLIDFNGPLDSSVADTTFKVSFIFNEYHPQNPPKICFQTPMSHPNIFPSGEMCGHPLLTSEWNPSIQIWAVLLTLQLSLPDCTPCFSRPIVNMSQKNPTGNWLRDVPALPRSGRISTITGSRPLGYERKRKFKPKLPEPSTCASSNFAVKRIHQDFQELQREEFPGIWAEQTDDAFMWSVGMCGPPETPLEERLFEAVLLFDENHPYRSPRMIFTSPVFHPNVFPTGEVCVDGLLDEKWSPCTSIWSLLVSIQYFLNEPSPEKPANDIAATFLVESPREYSKMASMVPPMPEEDESFAHNFINPITPNESLVTDIAFDSIETNPTTQSGQENSTIPEESQTQILDDDATVKDVLATVYDDAEQNEEDNGPSPFSDFAAQQ